MSGARDLRRAGLSFFGKVTTGVTHEIRNSLAVLKEIAGLMSDIAGAAGDGGTLEAERVSDLAGRMNAQVERANQTVGLLNRFAHSVDYPRRTVDLAETVSMLADLGERHAHRNRVQLATEIPKAPISVESDPFLLEHAIFLLLTRTVEEVGEGGSVLVTLEPEGSGARLRFGGAPRGRVRLRGSLTDLMALLGSEVEYDAGGNDSLVLTIPGRMPGGEGEGDD